jgi:dTDP-4-amino-4,6-dideoxygalactose transaminase
MDIPVYFYRVLEPVISIGNHREVGRLTAMIYQSAGDNANTMRIPVYQPKLPSAEKLLPYLHKIDKNRWYSNHGMLHTHQHFAAARHDPLPHTTQIAPCLVALPTAIDLSHEAMERIVAALSEGRRHQKTD